MASITGITTSASGRETGVMFRTILKIGMASVMLSLASVAFAQQGAAPATQAQPVPYVNQPAAQAVPAPAQPAAPAPATAETQAPAPATAPAAVEAASTAAKSVFQVPRELSPWSMFLSADIVVKVVMIGLTFASLVTWTILIAKMIELSVAKGKLKSSLRKVDDARSLAEAQMALGKK